MAQRAQFTVCTAIVLLLACFFMTLLSRQVGLAVFLLLFMGGRFWRWYEHMLR